MTPSSARAALVADGQTNGEYSLTKIICDACGGTDDVLPCPTHFHPHRTQDLCRACRLDLQAKRDAAAAVGRLGPPPDVNQ